MAFSLRLPNLLLGRQPKKSILLLLQSPLQQLSQINPFVVSNGIADKRQASCKDKDKVESKGRFNDPEPVTLADPKQKYSLKLVIHLFKNI